MICVKIDVIAFTEFDVTTFQSLYSDVTAAQSAFVR